MSYDAIVVGSGPNGLSAAITMARAGRRVLVLEAADRAGGAVASEELTLPGFVHDTFSAVYPSGAASPAFASMPLERHGLSWVHPKVCLAHPLPDGTAAALHRDLGETAASLDALHAGDGRRWREFALPYVRGFAALRDTMLSGFPPLAAGARLTRALGPAGMLEFTRMVLMPASALAAELFRGDGARGWLYGSAMHSDMPPTDAGTAVAATYLMLLGHGAGWPSPQGGAGMLAKALLSYLDELGGCVRTGSRVTRVACERSRVAGVVLDSGERVAAPLVLADVMPAQLLSLAAGDLPARYAAALGRYRMGPSSLKVDWALDGPIPWEAELARSAGVVHVGGYGSEMLGGGRNAGPLAEHPFLLLGQQSIADPTRAPAGCHTAWAYTRGPRDLDWAAHRERHVDRIESQVERFAPGFRDRILARHVLGPSDMQSRNANLLGGDVGGGSYSIDQVLMRPVPSLTPYRTPLRGLYLCSAATFPGGAVHGVCGRAAARLALAEERVRLAPRLWA